MATVIGVDLGAHAVKVAVMEGRLGRVTLREYRIRRIEQGLEGPPELELRLEVLQKILADLGDVSTATWAAAYPTEWVSLRLVGLPFQDRGQIDRTLAFELEGHVPFDLSDFVLDSRVLENGAGLQAKDRGEARVLCALADKTRLSALVSGLEARGVEPRKLALDAELLVQMAPSHGVQVVVDIGHTRTLVACVAEGELLSARAISFGGYDLTAALVEKFGWNWEDAEGQKHIAHLDRGSAAAAVEWTEEPDGGEEPTAPVSLSSAPNSLNTVLAAGIESLVSGLKGSLLAFESQHGLDVEELIFTGGGSELGGLIPRLSAETALPARRVSVSEEAESMGDPGRFALSHSLAALGAGMTGGRELQFRRGDFSYKGDLALARTLVGYAGVAAVFFLVTGLVLFGFKRFDLGNQLDEKATEIAAVVSEIYPELPLEIAEDPELAHSFMLELTADAASRVEILEDAMLGEPPTLLLLKEISQAMPSGDEVRIEVRELTISPASIRIRAETTGYEAAATIEQALQANPRFKGARKGDEKKLGDGISFSITIPLGEESEEEG